MWSTPYSGNSCIMLLLSAKNHSSVMRQKTKQNKTKKTMQNICLCCPHRVNEGVWMNNCKQNRPEYI